MSDLLNRLRLIRREASLNADEVATLDEAIEALTTEWEYGCANFGDLDDVITVPGPLALQGKTDREWAEGVLQPEYGDILVRRRRVGAWSPVHTGGAS